MGLESGVKVDNEILFKFENLKVYQKGLDYIDWVYGITKNFPKDELFGLTSQFRRASQSIALNIAEGAGENKKQFVRYLIIAKGSLRECVVCTTIAKRQRFIDDETENYSRLKLEEKSRMISGLIKSLQQ